MKRADETIQVVKDLVNEKDVDYAVVSSCFYHTNTLFKEEYLANKILGKTIAQAVAEFMKNKTGSLINECSAFGCE